MTRINLVEPYTLCDQHLLAEYRELPRIVNKALKAVQEDKKLKTIEGKYRLGKGHVTFFYNKCDWLIKRFNAIYNELERRKFNLNFHGWPENEIRLLKHTDYWDCYDTHGNYGWSPDYDEMMLNRVRIAIRMPEKPRYYKKVITEDTILE